MRVAGTVPARIMMDRRMFAIHKQWICNRVSHARAITCHGPRNTRRAVVSSYHVAGCGCHQPPLSDADAPCDLNVTARGAANAMSVGRMCVQPARMQSAHVYTTHTRVVRTPRRVNHSPYTRQVVIPHKPGTLTHCAHTQPLVSTRHTHHVCAV